MKPIQAIYQDGVFRPTTPVDLPEGSEVTVEPHPTAELEAITPQRGLAGGAALEPEDVDDPFDDQSQPQPTDAQFAHLEPGQAKIYALLSHRYDGGETDGAARHNEHQP